MLSIDPSAPRCKATLAAREAANAFDLAAPGRASIAARLRELINEASSEYALAKLPTPESIAAFGRALSDLAVAEVSTLRLTPEGGIWAEWDQANTRSIALVIRPNGTARLGAVLLQVQDPRRWPLFLDVEGELDSVMGRARIDPALHPRGAWVSGA
jgi:hypothetical protein